MDPEQGGQPEPLKLPNFQKRSRAAVCLNSDIMTREKKVVTNSQQESKIKIDDLLIPIDANDLKQNLQTLLIA